jgi:hypothetical protein
VIAHGEANFHKLIHKGRQIQELKVILSAEAWSDIKINSHPQIAKLDAECHELKAMLPPEAARAALASASSTQMGDGITRSLRGRPLLVPCPQKWETYRSSEQGDWWWCEATQDFFFVDNPGPWTRYYWLDKERHRHWWCNEQTGEWFKEPSPDEAFERRHEHD